MTRCHRSRRFGRIFKRTAKTSEVISFRSLRPELFPSFGSKAQRSTVAFSLRVTISELAPWPASLSPVGIHPTKHRTEPGPQSPAFSFHCATLSSAVLCVPSGETPAVHGSSAVPGWMWNPLPSSKQPSRDLQASRLHRERRGRGS